MRSCGGAGVVSGSRAAVSYRLKREIAPSPSSPYVLSSPVVVRYTCSCGHACSLSSFTVIAGRLASDSTTPPRQIGAACVSLELALNNWESERKPYTSSLLQRRYAASSLQKRTSQHCKLSNCTIIRSFKMLPVIDKGIASIT